jgi:L-fuculose-phosphate aldolase
VLEELKQRVWQVAEDVMAKGLVEEKGGNFSIYDADSGHVVITPSGVHRAVLTPEDICVVDLQGKVIEGDKKPSSETPMHTAVYRGRPSLGGIVHTHSTYATAFAVLNKEIPPILPVGLMLGPSIPVVPFTMPGTEELGTTAVPYLETHSAVLLQNHGALSVGKTIEEALWVAIYVEEIAKVYHVALSVGEPIPFAGERLETLLRLVRGGVA